MVAVAVVTLRFSWLSDDALITARTALNFLHGYGPDFNIDERVMGYTHPLWFLQMVAMGWLTGDVIVLPLIAGVVLTSAAWLVVVLAVRGVSRIALGTVALLLSNSVVEYASSGLENCLAYAVLAGMVVLGRRCEPGIRRLGSLALGLGILAAAALLTRLDLIIMIAPAVVLLAWRIRHDARSLGLLAAGLLVPLFCWATFAFSYYGNLLPSTLDAKTNVGIPRFELLVSGVNYLVVSFTYDPVALVVLVTAAACAIFVADAQCRAWILGVGAYLAYVVWIGGDFMAGRFLAVPVVVALAVLMTAPPGTYVELVPRADPFRVASAATFTGIAALAVLGLGRSDVLTPGLPDAPRWDLSSAGGVADERGFYLVKGRGLMQYLGSPQQPADTFVDPDKPPEGWLPDLAQLRATAGAWPAGATTEAVKVKCGGLGEASIAAGPAVHWIDPCGLTDRFLASIPYRADGFHWRIGHFDRPLPEGYLEAVTQADPGLVADPALRWELERLWERIRP